MKSFLAQRSPLARITGALAVTLLAASAISSCASVTTKAYANGTVASSEVGYTYESPVSYRTGRGLRYFVDIHGAPSWEKVSIPALQTSGMGRTSERERAKLVVTIDVHPVDSTEGTAVATESGFLPGVVARAWYEIRFDGVDGQEVSGSSAEFSQVVTDPNGRSFATAEEARSARQLQSKIVDDGMIRELQAAALKSALQDVETLAGRLFTKQEITLSVPVIRSAAGLELEEGFKALSSASTPAEFAAAQEMYERANRQLDEQSGGSNATARYGVLCGLAACRLMVDDFRGAWQLTNRALELEPQGAEASAIRAAIYEEELATGIREIPKDDRRVMDQDSARDSSSSDGDQDRR